MSATRFLPRFGCPVRGFCLRNALLPLLTIFIPFITQAAHAQSPVTDADIVRAQRSQPVITEQDIERARRQYRMPSEAELRNVLLPSTPNIGALPQPASNTPLDLAAIANGFDANAEQMAQAQATMSGPALLVFVSFAMPQATLQRLVDQAARASATLVLRGFVNGSLRETVLRVQRLIGQRHVSFQIDPQAFDRFAINKTPSFVLLRAGAQTNDCASGFCYTNDAFVATSGDVSLDYALAYMQRTAPRFAPNTVGFLHRLRSAP